MTDTAFGAAYRSVLPLNAELAVGRKAHLVTVVRGDDRFHFDLEGRLHRAWWDGVSYQRGLDGRVRRVSVERRGPEHDRWLTFDVLAPSAGAAVLDAARAAAGRARRLAGDALPELAPAVGWDASRYAAERVAFQSIYGAIPILPPAQNRALVIQATQGCAWNRCRFCHLYADTPFRARDDASLRRHVREVLGFVGRALPLRRGIFLGQANALCLTPRRIERALVALREELSAARGEDETDRLWSLASFVDAFSRRFEPDELVGLRRAGLHEVTLGLESGAPSVLESLGKPVELDEATRLVAGLRSAGIRLGIVLLIGAGGVAHATRHVRETIAFIAGLRLARCDRVYLSPLVAPAGTEPAPDALDARERADQARQVREGLRAAGVSARVALYDIRRFIY